MIPLKILKIYQSLARKKLTDRMFYLQLGKVIQQPEQLLVANKLLNIFEYLGKESKGEENSKKKNP